MFLWLLEFLRGNCGNHKNSNDENILILIAVLFSTSAFAQNKALENGDTLVIVKITYHLNNGVDSTVEKRYIKKDTRILYSVYPSTEQPVTRYGQITPYKKKRRRF